MKRILATTAAAAALGLWAAPPADAQSTTQEGAQKSTQSKSQQQDAKKSTQASQQQSDKSPVLVLREWNYDAAYDKGWSVKKLIDMDLKGANGGEIGEVENVIIGSNGRIAGIIAEVGGFANIADTHVFVPWDQVKFKPGLAEATVPVTEENAEEYAFSNSYLVKAETGSRHEVPESGLVAGIGLWKATDLLGDYAYLNGFTGYGWINDLVFTAEGKLHAVVVNADSRYGGGYYAFPYYGYPYGWTPGTPYYALHYGEPDIVNLRTFDKDKMNKNLAMENSGSDSAGTTTGAAGQSTGAKGQSKGSANK